MIVFVPAPAGFLEYVNATVAPTVSIENVLLVGESEIFPARSDVEESETVAVPSL